MPFYMYIEKALILASELIRPVVQRRAPRTSAQQSADPPSLSYPAIRFNSRAAKSFTDASMRRWTAAGPAVGFVGDEISRLHCWLLGILLVTAANCSLLIENRAECPGKWLPYTYMAPFLRHFIGMMPTALTFLRTYVLTSNPGIGL